MDLLPHISQNPNALTPEVAGHMPERASRYVTVLKGFELLALAATFFAAVQAQVMGTTIGITGDAETTALIVINSLFLAGFAFSITSALLAFLTARWLQCLTIEERDHFEIAFQVRERIRLHRFNAPSRLPDVEQGVSARPFPNRVQSSSKEDIHPSPLTSNPRLVHIFFAHNLFIPMTLLVVGFVCTVIGVLLFAWVEHSLAVAIVLTVVYVILFPFAVGVFLIGRNPNTRLAVIYALSQQDSDW